MSEKKKDWMDNGVISILFLVLSPLLMMAIIPSAILCSVCKFLGVNEDIGYYAGFIVSACLVYGMFTDHSSSIPNGGCINLGGSISSDC